MPGLLRGTFLCYALALSGPAGAQRSDAPLHATAPPDTAHLRQGLAAALGSDFEIVRTELQSGLHERGGIFQPFVRGGSSPALPGSGLGLALVAAAAKVHRGQIDVRERDGGGAVFTLRLPAADRREGGAS